MAKEILLSKLMACSPHVSVTLTAEDLREFATQVVNETIASMDATAKEEPIWLSPEQVAHRLGVNKATLWRWNKIGYLSGTKFGAKLRYRQSDVERIESSEKKRK